MPMPDAKLNKLLPRRPMGRVLSDRTRTTIVEFDTFAICIRSRGRTHVFMPTRPRPESTHGVHGFAALRTITSSHEAMGTPGPCVMVVHLSALPCKHTTRGSVMGAAGHVARQWTHDLWWGATAAPSACCGGNRRHGRPVPHVG